MCFRLQKKTQSLFKFLTIPPCHISQAEVSEIPTFFSHHGKNLSYLLSKLDATSKAPLTLNDIIPCQQQLESPGVGLLRHQESLFRISVGIVCFALLRSGLSKLQNFVTTHPRDYMGYSTVQ